MTEDEGSSRGGVLLELPVAHAAALVQLIRDTPLDARVAVLDARAAGDDASIAVLAIEPGLGVLLARAEVREFILERPAVALALMSQQVRGARIADRDRDEVARAARLLEHLGWLAADGAAGEVWDLDAHRRSRRQRGRPTYR
jgi:hypothetical protein